MAGFKDDFTPEQNYSNVTLTATLERNNQVVEEVTIPYNCEQINKDSCNQNPITNLSKTTKTGILLISLLTLIAILAIFIHKLKSNRGFKVLFFALMLGGMFLGVGEVEGADAEWEWTDDSGEAYYCR